MEKNVPDVRVLRQIVVLHFHQRVVQLDISLLVVLAARIEDEQCNLAYCDVVLREIVEEANDVFLGVDEIQVHRVFPRYLNRLIRH